MKLLYLIDSLGAGGAERSLAELLPFYRDAGIETSVVCLRSRKIGFESDIQLTGCDLAFLGGSGRLGWIRSFRHLVRKIRPDLIHTTLFDANITGRIGAIGTRVPTLTSLVSMPYAASRTADPNINRFAFRAVRAVDEWTSHHLTTHFHAITHAVKDAYLEWFGIPEERITVIERGRDARRLGQSGRERRNLIRERLGIPAHAHVLINVGRQEFQKGQRFLLQAFAGLLESHPELVLLLVGREGHLTAELRRLHEAHGFGDRVRFLGHRADVPDLLAASDIFVFPSLLEGLGGAVIEAMALGLPVVASDIPAMREVVEHGRTATLVPPEAPDSIARAIEDLLVEPSRREAFGRRAQQLFRERFEISRSAARMIQLYQELGGKATPSDASYRHSRVLVRSREPPAGDPPHASAR